MSNSRLEKFIYAICGMEVDDLPTPLSRIETLWNCLITGETPDFEPLSRNEKYLMSMLTGDVDALPEPASRSEKLLYKIATGETDLTDVPGYLSRYEELLKHLIENGGIGGTDFEYVLYTLNDSFSTLYSTAEAPVKSAILKGQTLVNKASIVERIAANDGWNNLSIELNYPLSINSKYLINVFNLPSGMKFVLTNRTSNSNWLMPEYVKEKTVFTSRYDSDSYITLHVNDSSTYRPLTQEEINKIQTLIIEYKDGMENWDIPYFEGMQSVKMPVLTTTGKNLWNISSVSFLGKDYKDFGKAYATLVNPLFTLKPNTKYSFTGLFNQIPNYNSVFMFVDSGGKEISLTYFSLNNTGNNEPKEFNFQRTFTTPSDGKLYLKMFPAYEQKNLDLLGELFNSAQIQLEESPTPTTYEPYKTNILTTTSKNLFDMNRPYDVITDSQATVVQDTNQITVSSAESGIYVNANFILDKDFFAGKTVTGSCLYESDEKDIGTVQITYQDGDGEHHYQWIRTPTTFTFPNSFIGDVMLSVSANNTGTPQSNTVTVKNIQLELGSTATSYEPYSEVTLRGIGDVKDTLDGNTGELTQRIGEEVLNTSNQNIKNIKTAYHNNNNGFYAFDILFNKGHHKSVNLFVSDKLANFTAGKNTTCSIANYEGSTFVIRIPANDDGTIPTLDDFKKWLDENSPTVQYELATPTIKTVDLSILDQDGQPTKLSTFNDVTHVSIEAEDLLPTVDLEVPTKIEETLSTLPTLMNDISETQQSLNESIDDQAENINEVSTAITEIRSDIL